MLDGRDEFKWWLALCRIDCGGFLAKRAGFERVHDHPWRSRQCVDNSEWSPRYFSFGIWRATDADLRDAGTDDDHDDKLARGNNDDTRLDWYDALGAPSGGGVRAH